MGYSDPFKKLLEITSEPTPNWSQVDQKGSIEMPEKQLFWVMDKHLTCHPP
jgi:hypothetical protein